MAQSVVFAMEPKRTKTDGSVKLRSIWKVFNRGTTYKGVWRNHAEYGELQVGSKWAVHI